MDFVKNQIQRIQQQLAGLTASQRMLTAALVAIMVMTLVYWGRYAGSSDMEALLDQDFAAKDISPISAQLKGKGIPFVVNGNRIMVSSERRWEALADITYAKLLPKNADLGFDEIVGKLSPFAAASERETAYNRVREARCAQFIGFFPGVENASVMLTAETRRTIGQSADPTASVNIQTTATEEDEIKRLVESATATVVGALPRLKPSNVMVTVNGAHISTDNADATSGGIAGGNKQFELIQKYESYRSSEIRRNLSYIPGVIVSVVAKLNTAQVQKDELKHDVNGVVSAPTESNERTSTTGGGGPIEEPGAVANTGLALENAGANGSGGSEETETRDKFENRFDTAKIQTVNQGGDATMVSASVHVPRSYFVNVMKSSLPAGQTPTEDAVNAFIQQRLPGIEASAKGAGGFEEGAKVFVDAYYDVVPQLAMAGAAPVTATASITTSIGRFGKEIALGGLALVSLFMVSMMVRKSTPPPVIIPSAAAPSVSQMLVAGEALAGEAGDGNPLLNGLELDEDAVVTQQMLDQVTTMVGDNPDAAASLVKRWLNRA